MGCSISVYLANTFLYHRTKNLLTSPAENLRYLGRYIDDLIGIWTGTNDIPNIFRGNVDDNIRLTYVIGGEQLEALDLVLFLNDTNSNKRIKTRILRKPTDGHLFLHRDSAHPLRLKKSIPYAQLLRLKRNCSDVTDYETASVLLECFRHRDYPKSLLDKANLKCNKKTHQLIYDSKITSMKRSGDGEPMTIGTDYYREDLADSLKTEIGLNYKKIRNDPTLLERTAYFGELLPLKSPRVAFRSGGSLGSRLGPIYKKGE